MSVSETSHSYSEFRGDQDGKKKDNVATSKSFLLFMFVAFVIGIILLVVGSNGHGSPSGVPGWALLQFAQQINGSVITSANRTYWQDVMLFNSMYDWRQPYCVVYCVNYADVNLTFWFANNWNLEMAIRGGRYSSEGWSNCDGCVILDMSNLTSVTLDMVNMTFTADAGASLATVYQALKSVGWMAPIAPITNMSLGGYTVGGGSNPMNRLLGLAVDSVQQFGALAADQTWLIANSTNSSGLLWALRGGGGGNFAIVVNVTMQAYPYSQSAIGGWITWPMSQSALVTQQYDQATFGMGLNGTSPWGFNLAWTSNATGMFITMSGSWVGNIAQGTAALEPFLTIPGGDINLVTGTYYDVMDALFMFNDQTLTRVNYTSRSGFFNQTGQTVVSGSFNTDVMNALNMYSYNSTMFNIGIWIEPFGAGTAVNSVPSDATAFVSRNTAGVFGLYVTWNAPNQTVVQTNAMNTAGSIYQSLSSYLVTAKSDGVTKLAFVSYPWNITNYGVAYYDTNYNYLQQMKEAYDPYNYITFPQGLC
jgi:hypothetical protein